MHDLLQFLGTVIVAIIGLIGIYIQSKYSNKLKNQKDLISKIDTDIQKVRTEANSNYDKMNKELQKLRKDSKEGDIRLHKKLDNTEMNALKRYLVTEMTKIKDGTYIPSEEEKRILKEAKDQYNDRGGDSYVDDMYDDLRNSNLI